MKRPYNVSYSFTVYGDIEVLADSEDQAVDIAQQQVARESGEVDADEVEVTEVEELEPSSVEFQEDSEDD